MFLIVKTFTHGLAHNARSLNRCKKKRKVGVLLSPSIMYNWLMELLLYVYLSAEVSTEAYIGVGKRIWNQVHIRDHGLT
jgi:hypothetical protein